MLRWVRKQSQAAMASEIGGYTRPTVLLEVRRSSGHNPVCAPEQAAHKCRFGELADNERDIETFGSNADWGVSHTHLH
jgi:hypothetical protein